MDKIIGDEAISIRGRLNFIDFITLSTLNVGIGAFCLSLTCIYAIIGRFDFIAALIPGLISYVGYAS